MTILKTYWNYVDCLKDSSLRMFAKPSAIVNQPNIATGCRGVFFRSVISEELDASDLLTNLQFDQVRKARSEPDNSLLYRPKGKDEVSIGCLRVIKPRRFTRLNNVNLSAEKLNVERVGKEFDVLLETTEFVLQSAQEQMSERFQLQETFGDFNVFFFGKRAEIFTYSGTLINARDNLQWRNQFLDNYERYLRGTRCAELKARAYLLYDDVMREGFILSATTEQDAVTEGAVRFNFTLLVTAKKIMGVIPPSRSSVLTLDKTGDFKSGITEFQFFRSLDPDLPSVISASQAEQFTEAGEIQLAAVPPNYYFVENRSLPGDDATEDLKQMMITRGLQAAEKQRQAEGLTVTDTSVDHDILLDFISASKLGSNTKLVISGARTLDVDNFNGDQLVDLLLDNKITVDDLKLKQAAAVADSLSRGNKDRIDTATASTLETLAKYFATNSIERVNTPVNSPQKAVISGGKEYVLQASLDVATLNSVITSTAPFKDFDQKSLSSVILKNTSVAFMEAAIKDNSRAAMFRVAEAYAAAFCIIMNPATALPFPSVTTNLPDVSNLNGMSNSLDYVKSKTVDKVQTMLDALRIEVRAAVQNAINNDLKMSGLFTLINLRLGTSKSDIFINEAILSVARTALPQNFSAADAVFLTAFGVMLSSIIAQMEKSIPKSSVDAVGGTIRSGTSIGAAGATYFTPAFVNALSPDADKEIAVLRVGPKDFSSNLRPGPGSDKYLILPLAEVVGSVSITYIAPGGMGAFGGPIKVYVDQTDNQDQILQRVGIIRLNGQQQSALAQAGAYIELNVSKRKTNVFVPGNTGLSSSVFTVQKFPIDQNHFGGAPVLHNLATPTTLLSLLDQINYVVAQFKSIAQETSSTLENVFSSEPDQASLDALKSQLAIEKFATTPEVAQIKTALDAVGVTVSNVIDLILYANDESLMAKNLVTLRQRILDGIAQAKNDPEGRAAAVAKSNESYKNSVCT